MEFSSVHFDAALDRQAKERLLLQTRAQVDVESPRATLMGGDRLEISGIRRVQARHSAWGDGGCGQHRGPLRRAWRWGRPILPFGASTPTARAVVSPHRPLLFELRQRRGARLHWHQRRIAARRCGDGRGAAQRFVEGRLIGHDILGVYGAMTQLSLRCGRGAVGMLQAFPSLPHRWLF